VNLTLDKGLLPFIRAANILKNHKSLSCILSSPRIIVPVSAKQFLVRSASMSWIWLWTKVFYPCCEYLSDILDLSGLWCCFLEDVERRV